MTTEIRHICLHVEGIIGTDLEDLCASLVAFANRMGVMVACDANGVEAIAVPGDDPGRVCASLRRQMAAR